MDLPNQIVAQDLLLFAARAASHGDQSALQTLVRAGFSTASLDRIATLTAADLAELIESAVPTIMLKVDGKALEKVMDSLVARRDLTDLYGEFLYRGATCEMMQDLFHLTRAQCQTLRRSLGLTEQRAHTRPPDMDPAECDDIRQTWLRLNGSEPERYIELSELYPKLSLGILWRIVRNRNLN